MRIALVLPRFGPHAGGVERYVWELSHGLARGGHDVHVFCHRADDAVDTKLTIRKVPVIRWHNALKIASFARNADRMIGGMLGDFDVVHGFGRTCVHDLYRIGGGVHRAYLARMKERGTGLWEGIWQGLDPRNWVVNRIERDIFREDGSRRFTAISRLCAADVERHYGIPASRIEVIYNGVDTEAFHPRNRERFREAFRRRHQVGEDETLLLFVGSGFERKGLGTVIEAMPLLLEAAPVRLVVVGRGNESRYRSLARALGLEGRVHLLGERTDVAEICASCDVFVLPTRYEPFGTVCLEAWATGLPVVVSRMSGASEILIEGQHGAVLADPNDARELAGKVVPLLSPAERARVAPLARSLAEAHTIQANIDRTVEIYRDIARARGRSGE